MKSKWGGVGIPKQIALRILANNSNCELRSSMFICINKVQMAVC